MLNRKLRAHRSGRAKHASRLGRAVVAKQIAEPWLVWIADNMLRGNDSDEIATALVARGVPAWQVKNALREVTRSPGFRAGLIQRRRTMQLELPLRLRRHQSALAARHEIEHRSRIDPEEFYERYYCTGTPLVLTDLMVDWPARKRWGMDDLSVRFGESEVQITSGRDADAQCDRNFEQHLETVTVNELVRRLRAAEGTLTNDFYLIANNRVLERSELGALLDDVAPPAFMGTTCPPDCASLWIGPGGTRTPMHHDTCNILFCQVIGRKRFRLISPDVVELLEHADGFYTDIDDQQLELLPSKTLELQAGMALFLPVGWWHEVCAQELSMSVSLLNFLRPNGVDWYAPGKVAYDG